MSESQSITDAAATAENATPDRAPSAERTAIGGLGVLTLLSAMVLVGSSPEVKAARQVGPVDDSCLQWVAAPVADLGLTAAPAVTNPRLLMGSPPPARDPMVLATAVLDHHRLVVLSLHGGLYGP
jgi:hypothetical protein